MIFRRSNVNFGLYALDDGSQPTKKLQQEDWAIAGSIP